MWKIYYTKQAQKDARKLASSGLKNKAEELLRIVSENPYQNPPQYEKSGEELRSLVLCMIGGKHWSAIITYRSEVIRIISGRRSRESEVALYES
jgi:toxin YoeB